MSYVPGTALRPTILAAAGSKAPPNIQLLKTVISQSGGQGGQATILLAQGAGHPATALQASSQPLTISTQPAGAVAGPGAAVAVSKGKAAPPIYARIIQPPPGLRLAAVRPGSVVAGGQIPGVSVIQAVPQDVAGSTPQAGSQDGGGGGVEEGGGQPEQQS